MQAIRVIFFLTLFAITGLCYAQSPPEYIPPIGGYTQRDGGPDGPIVLNIAFQTEVDACVTTVPVTADGTQGPFIVTVTGNGYVEIVSSTNTDFQGIIHITGPGTGTIVYSDKNNRASGMASFQVVALTPPTVTFLQAFSTTNCDGEAMSFHGEVTGKKKNNTHYVWEVNGVDMNVDAQDFTISTLKANDVIKFTATNYGACDIMSDSKTFTVPALKPSVTPVVTINPSQNPVCGDGPVTFTASTNVTDPGLTYQWFVNEEDVQTNSSVLKNYTFNNGDIVRCVAGNLNTCILPVSSDPVTIKRSDYPTVKFNGGVTLPYGSQVTLQPIATGDIATYSWSPADGLSDAGAANPLASPQTATKYTLTVANANGCTAQASVIVKVIIVIPNAFTPNGDGINDTWKIPGLANNPNYNLNVYNRYGNKVFESVGYTRDWDGTYGGKNLPSGTYYYFIQDKIAGDKMSGSVTIIR